jgi:hypothetical protein
MKRECINCLVKLERQEQIIDSVSLLLTKNILL